MFFSFVVGEPCNFDSGSIDIHCHGVVDNWSFKGSFNQVRGFQVVIFSFEDSSFAPIVIERNCSSRPFVKCCGGIIREKEFSSKVFV